jgi:hypothetical protein
MSGPCVDQLECGKPQKFAKEIKTVAIWNFIWHSSSHSLFEKPNPKAHNAALAEPCCSKFGSLKIW